MNDQPIYYVINSHFEDKQKKTHSLTFPEIQIIEGDILKIGQSKMLIVGMNNEKDHYQFANNEDIKVYFLLRKKFLLLSDQCQESPKESSGNLFSTSNYLAKKEDSPICRICHSFEPEMDLLRYDCNCIGSISFVHNQCLKHSFIQEINKLKLNESKDSIIAFDVSPKKCEICKSELKILNNLEFSLSRFEMINHYIQRDIKEQKLIICVSDPNSPKTLQFFILNFKIFNFSKKEITIVILF